MSITYTVSGIGGGVSLTGSGATPQAACEAATADRSFHDPSYFGWAPTSTNGGSTTWASDNSNTVCYFQKFIVGEGWAAPADFSMAITSSGTADPPGGGASAPAGSGTTVTCSVSPCSITVEHVIAIPGISAIMANPDPEQFVDLSQMAGMFLLAAIVIACARKIQRVFEGSPHE